MTQKVNLVSLLFDRVPLVLYFGSSDSVILYSVFGSLTTSSVVAMISLLGSILEVIEKLRPFARRSVSVCVSFLLNQKVSYKTDFLQDGLPQVYRF